MLCLVVAAVVAVVVARRPQSAVLPGDSHRTSASAADADDARADAASALVERLAPRLERGTRAQVTRSGRPG